MGAGKRVERRARTALSFGKTHGAVVINEKDLYVWGANVNGSLGLGHRTKDSVVPPESPILVPLHEIIASEARKRGKEAKLAQQGKRKSLVNMYNRSATASALHMHNAGEELDIDGEEDFTRP